MTSPKVMIGLIILFVIAQILCNWVDNKPMMSGTNPNILVDPNTNRPIPIDINTPVTVVNSVVKFCSELFFFDYTVFYNIDPITGVATDNDFVIIRWALIAFGLVMWLDILLTGRRLIFGG
jgi:hypothetical protein